MVGLGSTSTQDVWPRYDVVSDNHGVQARRTVRSLSLVRCTVSAHRPIYSVSIIVLSSGYVAFWGGDGDMARRSRGRRPQAKTKSPRGRRVGVGNLRIWETVCKLACKLVKRV